MRKFREFRRFRLGSIYEVHKDADGSFFEVPKRWQWAMFFIEILAMVILAVILSYLSIYRRLVNLLACLLAMFVVGTGVQWAGYTIYQRHRVRIK